MLVLLIVIASCKKDSGKSRGQEDLVRSSLSTSATAYDNATPDSWVNVTADEYNKLLTQVTQAVIGGATESFMNTMPATSWNTNVTAGGSELVTKLPASSYVIGWSVKTGSYPSASINSKLKVSSSQKTDYNTYGNALPDIGVIPPNTRVYFVLKQPSTTTPAAPCYTAVYNFISYFTGCATGGGPEFSVIGENSTISSSGIPYSSFSQVISTIRKPY